MKMIMQNVFLIKKVTMSRNCKICTDLGFHIEVYVFQNCYALKMCQGSWKSRNCPNKQFSKNVLGQQVMIQKFHRSVNIKFEYVRIKIYIICPISDIHIYIYILSCCLLNSFLPIYFCTITPVSTIFHGYWTDFEFYSRIWLSALRALHTCKTWFIFPPKIEVVFARSDPIPSKVVLNDAQAMEISHDDNIYNIHPTIVNAPQASERSTCIIGVMYYVTRQGVEISTSVIRRSKHRPFYLRLIHLHHSPKYFRIAQPKEMECYKANIVSSKAEENDEQSAKAKSHNSAARKEIKKMQLEESTLQLLPKSLQKFHKARLKCTVSHGQEVSEKYQFHILIVYI